MKFFSSLLFKLVLLFIFGVSSVSSADLLIEAKTQYINLIKGEYKDLKFDNLPEKSEFKFENKKFKKYLSLVLGDNGKRIRFKPKRTGTVMIRLVSRKDPDIIIKQFKVTIQKNNLDKIAKEIKELLVEIEGIEIKVLNNKVIVDGYILLAKDMNRIAMVLKQYPENKVASLIRLSPLTKKKIAERIEAEIDNPNIYVTVVNDFYILEGTESYAGEAQMAEKLAQAHISDRLSKFAEKNSVGGSSQILSVVKTSNPIINNIAPVRLAPPPKKKMIQIVVHYVELSKSYSKGFNFSWAPTISDGGNIQLENSDSKTSGFITTITATIANLLPKLNWAKEHGHARVLNTLNVIVDEGEEGTVSREVTIVRLQATAQGGSSPLTTKAQISTKVTPTLDPLIRDSVSMKINIEISEVSAVSAGGNTVAGNKVSTKVTIRNKHSAALAGLLRSSTGTDYNRIPAAESLFRLGASKSTKRDQSQFVIFATPYIRDNASQGVEKIKRKFRLDR